VSPSHETLKQNYLKLNLHGADFGHHMHQARVCHITHFRLKSRKSKSTKNTMKVDTKSGLHVGMMDIICVSMFECHKKLIISFFLSLRL